MNWGSLRSLYGIRKVSDGLNTTFALLESTANEAAVGALLPILDSSHRVLREGALKVILARRTMTGHREVLRRLHTLDEPASRIVANQRGLLSPAIRDALLSEEQPLRANACYALVWFREYDLIPVLLKVLEDRDGPDADLAARTLVELIDLLDEELSAPAMSEIRRDPQLVRQYVVSALEQSVERFVKHKRREVVEALVLLSGRDSASLLNILRSPYHPAFLVLIDILSKSRHTAVIGLLLSFLDDARAPSGILSVVSKRIDLPFVQALLRKVGRQPSAAVAANLKRMDSLAWLRSGGAVLDSLDDRAQHAAVRTVMASGTSRSDALAMVEYLLLHGKKGGRRAAAQALEDLHGAQANALALKALEDPDAQVQAHVVVQLRRRGIPGALPRLVEMIDSPHALVRKAARQSLAEFNFARFLAAFDMLDEEVRRSTGMLVKKVDPETIPLLEAEMQSPVRTRRLRAIAVIRAIDAAAPLEAALIRLTGDEESAVRAEAAQALAVRPSRAGREALGELLTDPSPAVREAADKALHGQCDFARWKAAVSNPIH